MATCRLTHHRAGVNAISDEGRINLCSGVRCDLLSVRVSRSERVFLSCEEGGGNTHHIRHDRQEAKETGSTNRSCLWLPFM